jgi:hypothetical protein
MSLSKRRQGPSGALNPAARAAAQALSQREDAYARALGRMLMRAGFLEHLVDNLAAHVLGLDPEQAIVVTGRMSFSSVCDMTVRLIRTWSPHTVRDEMGTVLRSAVTAMSQRNDMAHAIWASWEKSAHHIRWQRRDPIGREVPISEIDDLTEKLDGLIQNVMDVTSQLASARKAGEILPGVPT